MPLFEITPELQGLAQPITPGWHPCEITKIEDKPGTDGVMRTLFVHKILAGKDKGKMFFLNVSHDENMRYNFAYLDFITKGAFSRPVKDKQSREVTLANLPVKQFDAEIVTKMFENRPMDNLKNFAPLGTKTGVEAAKK